MVKDEVQNEVVNEEKQAPALNGMAILLLNCLLTLAACIGIIYYVLMAVTYRPASILMLTASIVYLLIVMPLLFAGLKILKPNEAYVLTIFGKYYGTLRGPGYFFVNPFATATKPGDDGHAEGGLNLELVLKNANQGETAKTVRHVNKKISLKAMTLNNDKQKINDLMGNPIEIGIVVIWRVVNTAKAVFSVDNYSEFLSIQCDSALRNIVRLYPYDLPGDDDEGSLRGSSQEVADKLKVAIQDKVHVAGLEVIEARITHLAYAPEIAAAMLQRQQAAAIIDARAAIVKGAVDMVEMALAQLRNNGIVELDEERKAAMVSNLLVVLCGNKDAQPIVNSGSIY
ncbi:MAG: SPFH domain-containing protein [Clostridiales Family XIII bacterium]|jgi:regulator of protease activity HflC (stomatin/prohibitin superfamily)|nr:SPFH domain-containing protein [Clostridiales Family XIII bacterium]